MLSVQQCAAASGVTPLHLSHLSAAQYRTTKNYVTGAFLGPRIGDKIVFSLLIFT